MHNLTGDDPGQLGPYMLRSRLGAGGMGVVYLGYGDDGQAVAVKTLPVLHDMQARTRIRREAAMLAQINHPRVARLMDADLDADRPWLALSYINGPSLQEATVPLSEPVLRELAIGLADALAALHAKGIIHRDVKPANVILTYDGPVLVDLGIARDFDATAMTRAGTILGSPGWMTPEHLAGISVGPAADVWGWASVITYAGTGRSPFGDGPAEALGWRIQHADPNVTGLLQWALPAVHAAFAKDPEARPTAMTLAALMRDPAKTARSSPDVTVELGRDKAPETVSFTVPNARGLRAPTSIEPLRPARSSRWRRVSPAVIAIAAITGLVVGVAAISDRAMSQANRPSSAQPGLISSGPDGGAAHSGLPMPGSLSGPPPAPATTTPAQAAAATGWPPLEDVMRAGPAGTKPPAFPTSVDGYELAAQWTTTIRTFEGPEWSTVAEFPGTMNGCDQQRFYIRWRSLNDRVTIEATFASVPDVIVIGTTVTGGTGWQSTDGCGQPAFRFHDSSDPSTLADVVVEIQQWSAAV